MQSHMTANEQLRRRPPPPSPPRGLIQTYDTTTTFVTISGLPFHLETQGFVESISSALVLGSQILHDLLRISACRLGGVVGAAHVDELVADKLVRRVSSFLQVLSEALYKNALDGKRPTQHREERVGWVRTFVMMFGFRASP